MKFQDLSLDSSKKVFRPRLETEFWVGEAISDIKCQKAKIKILDIFAGSGCIGVEILKNIKNSQVDFVDISADAVAQIRTNLKLNKVSKERYRIFRSNLFGKLRGKKYDFIFANPPYVALERINEVQKEVLENDPAAALFGGKDGMVLIERFLEEAGNYFIPCGKIFMEFDPSQKKEIFKILKKKGFKASFKKDQFGKWRWLEANF